MLWIAFAHTSAHTQSLEAPAADQQSLCWWALQFSPRVCVIDEAVLMEAHASTRLFGGQRTLLLRLRNEALTQGVRALTCAPTALGALALLRTLKGLEAPNAHLPLTASCTPQTLAQTLDPLDIDTLSATHPHSATMRTLGCNHLGQLRALPRGGVSRRFGAGLLKALDQAYGAQTETFNWLTLPEQFNESLECPAAVEVGSGLLFGVQRLLQRLQTWLQARQMGVLSLKLHWQHDTLRRQEMPDGCLSLNTATPTRDTAYLLQLAAEHLARTTLAAPVRQLRLQAMEVKAMQGRSHSLLPDPREQGESLTRTLERISARLGPERTQRPLPVADHRPEKMALWTAAQHHNSLPAKAAQTTTWPKTLALQPPWLLPAPIRLPVQQHRPFYHGTLTLLAGPQRLEAGWWPQEETTSTSLRDYYLAESPQAGLIWVYRERGTPTPHWYLHGVYG